MEIVQLSSSTHFSLFEMQVPNIERLDLHFGLLKTSGELHTSSLEFLCTGNTLRLVLGAPHESLSVSLGEHSENISLGIALLIQLITEGLNIVLQVAELAQESGTALRIKEKLKNAVATCINTNVSK